MKRYTDNNKIQKALELLDNLGQKQVFENLNRLSERIQFYDLTLLDYSYKDNYAVASVDENNSNVILINENFQSSPIEAIASLIAHEAMHVLSKATLEEEIQATIEEAQVWQLLAYKGNIKDKLVQRENNLLQYLQNGTIRNYITNNDFYKKEFSNE